MRQVKASLPQCNMKILKTNLVFLTLVSILLVTFAPEQSVAQSPPGVWRNQPPSEPVTDDLIDNDAPVTQVPRCRLSSVA